MIHQGYFQDKVLEDVFCVSTGVSLTQRLATCRSVIHLQVDSWLLYTIKEVKERWHTEMDINQNKIKKTGFFLFALFNEVDYAANNGEVIQSLTKSRANS